ncbi:DNA repair protein RadA [Atopobacter sp. AH10]|uniref:DNA repair protein RadA n=1 Tax=Atopobacter sp. AH10 TaxID=2315861 RepID=UPI000EF1F9CE|nr:DNA repair protein RadA [Atopobacter sp. AH10]RLK62809.1 DNA repair protein RadA [Atopobacter sp. AH10]
MAKKKARTIYLCDQCGYESPKWMGKCPNCGEWDALKAFTPQEATITSSKSISRYNSRPQAMKEISGQEVERLTTENKELDRVLGGGLVPGSLVLIGGDPGIGKSTLLLQVAAQMANRGEKVLYVSGEESEHQIKLRAERMAVSSQEVLVYSDSQLDRVVQVVESVQPKLLIVDSIQTMQDPDVAGMQGSVSNVREATASFMKLAKSLNVATFIVGHVTKEGNIAGPRMLEHMVDTVLYLEGEKFQSFRILRSVKNRFGATNEIGVFEMTSQGLTEVTNPSGLFLDERLAEASGSAVAVSLEGSRPILSEVQCLVTPTAFGNARRTTSGINLNKATLLMAVLEKRAGLFLQNQDAYFKSTGGLRLDEPAIDLAIAMSIVSSYYDQETKETDCFVGEIGLAGEIRQVNRIDERIYEAEKLGFKRIFVPQNNRFQNKSTSIEVLPVRTVNQVIRQVFKR